MSSRPKYFRVLQTFFRNSLVREMTFRGNFIINALTQTFWFAAQLTLFEIIYRNVGSIADWSREEYFVFLATAMLINAFVEMLFMPNVANFSELIRTGNLDFALLKPIDTQFLVSFEKIDLSMLSQVILAAALLVYSLGTIGRPVGAGQAALYAVYVIAGVVFFYDLMLALASTSIWFGRNQGLYDFWFYVTVFARYPRSIYNGTNPARLEAGEALQFAFTYLVPILLVVTVPARIVANTVDRPALGVVALAAAAIGVLVSRAIFHHSLKHYRSASS